ncbi:MAG: phosphatase PAP2 family protein [Bacteroidaceae bacterium]|nr:phosphatase PAP2 family protein [Bacteroidaceae bacterium]
MVQGKRLALINRVEFVAAAWCLLTLAFMGLLWSRLINPAEMLLMRGEWLLMTVVLVVIGHLWPCRLTMMARITSQLAWLAQWYPDTYEFNRILPNLDHVFAGLEQTIFGCQPSLLFCELCPGKVWSELLNMGYWSYYPMIIVLVLTIFAKETLEKKPASDPNQLSVSVPTLILTSFFTYYLIYNFLPVAGPQYYFQAIGLDAAAAGQFPSIGTYFSSHTEMLPNPGDPDGLFHNLVASAHAAGERPTAAFPSSHIGVSTIVLILARLHVPRLVWFLLPFYVLLCLSTVYIQAHYLIDAIAGLISGPLVLALANCICNSKLIPQRLVS